MTFEEYVLSLGYTHSQIAKMPQQQISWLRARWFAKREGKE